jgi:hypothetical protein
MDNTKSKFNIVNTVKIILIAIGILMIITALAAFIKLKAGARVALRDAKDVQMALETRDVEMYASGKTIYNPQKAYGIEDGVKEKVEEIAFVEGKYYVTSYNLASREITGFKYRVGNYVVYYNKSNDKVKWDVDYILRVYTFEDKDE